MCVCVCEVMTALDSLPCIDNVWSQQPAEDEKPPSSFSKLYPSPISPPPSLLHSTISHVGGEAHTRPRMRATHQLQGMITLQATLQPL